MSIKRKYKSIEDAIEDDPHGVALSLSIAISRSFGNYIEEVIDLQEKLAMSKANKTVDSINEGFKTAYDVIIENEKVRC